MIIKSKKIKKILLVSLITMALLTACGTKEADKEKDIEVKTISLGEAMKIANEKVGDVIFHHEDEEKYYFTVSGSTTLKNSSDDMVNFFTVDKKTGETITILTTFDKDSIVPQASDD